MSDSLWHTKTAEQVVTHFHSSSQGLLPGQVSEHRQTYGSNTLPEKKPDSIWLMYLRQFQSPLIYVLLVASILILLIGEYTDAIIIVFVLLFNAVVGTIQEGKAQNTLASLKRLVETKAVVLRGGIEEIIPDTEVVAGDILVLHEGDKVPADARVIEAVNLTVDESSLTGESQPVYKTAEAMRIANLTTAEQKNMLFKGTNIVAGSGMAIAAVVGINTVIGRISREIASIESEDPLKKDIKKLSRAIIIVVAVMCVVLFVAGIIAGNSAKEMFTTVVSLAVSVIPEGLPIVLTLVLATGVWRMSKKNALVKKLQAVESLGQASIIAVDKTGTITKNELTVTQVHVDGKTFTVTGSGYQPTGNVEINGVATSLEDAGLSRLSKFVVLCANAHVAFSEEKKIWQVSGDPTEAALLVFGEKVGFVRHELEASFPKLAEIPFSYQKKYHAVLHKTGDQATAVVVGAPEAVLKLSSSQWHENKNSKITQEMVLSIEEKIVAMSRQGLRVLGVASRSIRQSAFSPEDIEGLTFVGLIGMKDVLRAEVKDAVTRARDAGIKVVMITGDHKITAQAIAEEAGIFTTGSSVLAGTEIEKMTDIGLAGAVARVSVFARVTPEHKLRIIRAYQANGEIIAMTGDGVNDAPSLVAADLGVAMGSIGTEVAKQAADIVLLDDNFGSIISAVEEGRNIYKTIKKVILYLFSTSMGEALTIIVAIFLGLPLPVLASQIIWLNFVTDGFLDVSLAMEPQEKGLLKEPRAKTAFIDVLMAQRMALMSITMTVGALWLFSRSLDMGIVKAQTMALTVLAVYQWFNAWNCRNEKESLFTKNFASNKFLIGATAIVAVLQLLAVYNPFLQRFLHTTSLDFKEWLLIVCIASSIVVVEELRKLYVRKFSK